jgi:hypothetical protein
MEGGYGPAQSFTRDLEVNYFALRIAKLHGMGWWGRLDASSVEKTVELRSTGQPTAAVPTSIVDRKGYTLCGPRFFCCWHLVMIAERNRLRRSSGNS